MSKPESKLAVSATFLFLIATFVLYMVSLPHTLRTLRDHFENAKASKWIGWKLPQSFPILTGPAKTLVPTRNISGKALKFPIPSRTINTTSHRTATGRLFSRQTTVASHHPSIRMKKSCFLCTISCIASISSESPTSPCTQPHRLCPQSIIQMSTCAWSNFVSISCATVISHSNRRFWLGW